MANGLRDIIQQLEQQRNAIERALSALREIDGEAVNSVVAPPASGRVTRKNRMMPEGKKRRADSTRRRRAVKRTASTAKKTPGRSAQAA
jgi:hypothetical protein